MKLSLGLLMILFLALGAVACSDSSDVQNESSVNGSSAFSRVALEVPTMFRSGCEPRAAASAKSIPGAEVVELDGQTVTITYNPEQATPDAIVEAIERRGDRVTKVTKL